MQPVVLLVLSQVTPHEQNPSLFIFLDKVDKDGQSIDNEIFVKVFQGNITNTEGNFEIRIKKRKMDKWTSS